MMLANRVDGKWIIASTGRRRRRPDTIEVAIPWKIGHAVCKEKLCLR
jgi:hypothetical protein